MPDHARRVLLFDLYSTGHHLQYLSQLASFWVRNELKGQLDIVVPSYFVNAHPAFVTVVQQHRAKARINLISIEEQVFVEDTRRFRLIRSDLEFGRLLTTYIEKLRPDYCVIMYLDNVQLSLAMGLRFDFPVQLSGIYFRPSFHYKRFSHDQSGVIEKIKRLRKRLVLSAALRNPHFTDLFCLDPFVVPYIKSTGTRAVFLPDGIEQRDTDPIHANRGGIDSGETQLYHSGTTRSVMLRDWGVENGRKVVLFFGGINSRKGVFQVLDAASLLASGIQEKLCLVFVGVIEETERIKFLNHVESCRKSTVVQLIVQSGFVDETDVQDIIRGADLVLITYQRHLGSSGVLIRAATEKIPVLGSDYGLIGENIRRHHLGLSVDTTSPREIAHALTRFISDPGSVEFDAEKALAFARQNTADEFCSTIFDRALLSI